MGDSESEKLCACLTESVGDRPAGVFYQEFNLEKPTVFSEFYFKEMMQIYYIAGMEDWPKLMNACAATNKQGSKPPPKMYLSLVCFWPPCAIHSSKELPKKANEAQSKKQRASTVVNSGKTLVPILPGRKKHKRGKKHGKQEIDGIPNAKDEIICHAGLECWLGDINVVVEGNVSNGSLCSKCQKTFHFAFLYQFQEDKYCTSCYKEHVVSQCETGTLFQDLLQSEEMAKAKTSPTHIKSDLHVDY
jgi:hypothetical protein